MPTKSGNCAPRRRVDSALALCRGRLYPTDGRSSLACDSCRPTLSELPDGALVRCCGIVTLRQQPAMAKGVIFVSLEDEAGVVQIIVWKSVRERQRAALLQSRLLAVQGRWQRDGEVCNVVAARLVDLTPLLGRLAEATNKSRDFH